MNAYKDDLAYIHDVGFGDFARNSAPGLLRIMRRNGISGGLVVDLGCGSGIWAEQLARSGYGVLGIDISPAMIEIARRRVPSGEFRVGSLLKTRLPRCAAVTSLGECLNYLFDPNNSLNQLAKLFRQVHEALEPGGLFIFDVAEPGRGKGPRQKHAEGKDWAVLVDVEENTTTHRLTRRITTFRREGQVYRRDQETHRLQLYRRAQVAKELREAGFLVHTHGAYGRQKMLQGCVALVARKPGRTGGR